jgi:hypothetical protein
MAPESSAHVSPNRRVGSLSEASLEKILDACWKHQITGRITIAAEGREGHVELRAGAVSEASWGELAASKAVDAMNALRDGEYQLVQRLPDLSGSLGDAAAFEGALAETPLAKIMQHCEAEALSCAITVVSGFDRGEITYRGGELVQVVLNGKGDSKAVDAIGLLPDGRFRVAAPPLSLEIDGWPAAGPEPTVPFRIGEAGRAREAERPSPDGRSEPASAEGVAAPSRASRIGSRLAEGIMAAVVLAAVAFLVWTLARGGP